MPNVLFCMTPGVGLNTWENIGSLTRELKPYVEYVRRGWKVKILTFDTNNIPKLPDGIEAVVFRNQRLLWFLPWTHKELGRWADVIKTNQSNKAFYYTRAVRVWRKPILLRCGYVQGEYLETTVGLTPKVRLYQWLEGKAFRQATLCQVPTKDLSEWVQQRYRVPEKKIFVVPNFVDTELFKPMPEVKKYDKSIISVGRLAPVKQFDLLIRACAEIPNCILTIVGEGAERQKLEKLSKELNVNLRLPGNIPNEDLPKILNQHEIFAITSKREGHPKALIEAMACGMPCIGVKAKGIQSIIRHGENGFCVAPNIRDLKRGIEQFFEDPLLASYLKRSAREFVIYRYSIEHCFNLEFRNIESLVDHC